MVVSVVCLACVVVIWSYYLTATVHSINTSLTLQCFTHTLTGNLPLTYLKQHLRRGFVGVYRGEELSICNFTPPPKPCPTNRSNAVIPRIPLECLSFYIIWHNACLHCRSTKAGGAGSVAATWDFFPPIMWRLYRNNMAIHMCVLQTYTFLPKLSVSPAKNIN